MKVLLDRPLLVAGNQKLENRQNQCFLSMLSPPPIAVASEHLLETNNSDRRIGPKGLFWTKRSFILHFFCLIHVIKDWESELLT